MKIIDRILRRPSGVLCYEIRSGGRVIETVRERNLIVDNSRTIHAKLLGGSFANQPVTQFGVGTNGTAPASGNTALSGAFLKAVDSVTFPAAGQVQFAFSLASGEANGMAILEFGLLTANNTLYARRVRSSALNKASDISISGTWTISF